jgi:ABC-type Zn2+ transport system substrate-binding protein/surface adhesin
MNANNTIKSTRHENEYRTNQRARAAIGRELAKQIDSDLVASVAAAQRKLDDAKHEFSNALRQALLDMMQRHA